MIGLNIARPDARSLTQAVQAAETAGVPAVWTTIVGAGGGDLGVALGGAAMVTDSIKMGTSVIPTWPRHPVVLAQQALALASLAPGRFRLGIGPSHRAQMEQQWGVEWRTPLRNLREYLTVIGDLLRTGSVDYQGDHVAKALFSPTAGGAARFPGPVDVPLMASALRPASFRVCGELADGAISWVCPWDYLRDVALPALRAGAATAGRAEPPLIAHVPICISEDREAVSVAANAQIGGFLRNPFYTAMFAEAGFEDAGSSGVTDAILEGLVVYGSESAIAERLNVILNEGAGEIIAHPIVVGDNPKAYEEAVYKVIVEANRRRTQS